MIEIADSLVVKFGTGADSTALVKLELDDELNDGKTSFSPGDTINIRLHHDSSVQLQRIAATDFTIAEQGSADRGIEEETVWTLEDDEYELGYNPSTSLLHRFFGKEATGLSVSDRTVTITGGELPSQCRITYAATFSLFRLVTPVFYLDADESYPLAIVAYMEDVQ